MLAGVLPTPAVALLALDLGVVVSASHNPPEYNGVKFFTKDGSKLTDADEEEIEALLDAPPQNAERGQIDDLEVAVDSYLDHVLDRFGADLERAQASASTARTARTPGSRRGPSRTLGAEVTAIGVDSGRDEHQRRLRRDRPAGAPAARPRGAASTSASRSTATATGCSRSTATATPLDGDQILAILALDLKRRHVAVTTMTNLGFHRLMEERGIRVLTTDVGDRYVLEALKARGRRCSAASSRATSSSSTATSPATGSPARCCSAARSRAGRSPTPRRCWSATRRSSENVRVSRRRELGDALRHEVDRLNAELAGRGRILVRPSGTEPVIRVLAEAETEAEARDLCATIAALVESELG